MDDISRGSSPEDSGAAPVSERQKGPEELVRFERGHVDEVDGGSFAYEPGHRLSAAATPPELRSAAGDEASAVTPEEEEAVDGPAGAPEEQRGGGESGAAGRTPGADEEAPLAGASAGERAGQEGDSPTGDGASAGVDAPAGADAPEDGQPTQGTDPSLESDPGAPDDLSQADIDEEAARAAVAAEEGTASMEQDLDEILDTDLGEDGLPIVPELQDVDELCRVLFVLMLSSRDGMTVFRLAQACNTSQKLVEQALDQLQAQLRGQGLPVELARVGDTVRWMSAASTFPYLQRLRGVKKLEKLSPAALETLAVIAYRQPVMRSEIEAIRGVKAGPMLRTLLQHKLVKVAGRADVPGRPLQYGTTPNFLERFGLTSLQDLPSVKEWKNLG